MTTEGKPRPAVGLEQVLEKLEHIKPFYLSRKQANDVEDSIAAIRAHLREVSAVRDEMRAAESPGWDDSWPNPNPWADRLDRALKGGGE